jgi:signal transduction histidine kinase
VREKALLTTKPSDVDEPTPDFTVLPGSGRAGALVVVAVGVLVFLAQWVSVALWVPPVRVSSIWLGGGVMLAAALLTERRHWPAVIPAGATGQTLLFLALQLVHPAAAILLGLLAALQTGAVASALCGVLRRPFTLSTLREFRDYGIVAVVGGAICASLLFLAGAWGMRFRPATFLTWRTFVLSAALGYLIVTPTVVLLVQRIMLLGREKPKRPSEAIVLGVLLTLVSGLVFVLTARGSLTWPVLVITIPALLLWAVMRFGAHGASGSLLVVAVVSSLGAAHGLTLFPGRAEGDHVLLLQLFLLGTGLPVLGMGVVMDEQKYTTSALQSARGRLQKLNRDLIKAREEEATRIARELHDDVGQRLALISIGLSRLRRSDARGTRPEIRQLQEQTGSVVRSLRELSQQLHPAVLEHAGLASALQMKCDEVFHATGIQVRLVSRGETSEIPPDIALCLFRVVQEALNNVVRHSGAQLVDLTLDRRDGELRLQVTDDGRGFVPDAAPNGNGLGLYHVTERLGAFGGRLSLESAPGTGTTLRVAVPLNGVHDA